MNPAPLPPSSGLSDERLAELRKSVMDARYDVDEPLIYGRMGRAQIYVRALEAELDRTREDAALGAALRRALADVGNREVLELDTLCALDAAVIVDSFDLAHRYTDATKALAALLSRASAERTKTP